MLRIISRLFKPSYIQPRLGRWETADNSDIKSALANIDCCGDKLCGDPHTSKQAIDTYTKVKSYVDTSNKDVPFTSNGKKE